MQFRGCKVLKIVKNRQTAIRQKIKAGWCYGFIASKKHGSCVYGKIYRNANGKAKFSVPGDIEYLWLVVSGAPAEHWPVATGRQKPQNNSKEEQWPYEIKLSGTSPDESVIKYM
jgi:hypothetical protein